MARSRICRIALSALALLAAAGALAQPYPNKPIRLLIPFPPGTGNDVVGRIVGNKLAEYLGQPVVADNRAGASGNIAIEAARAAPADGYTLVVASTSFSINLYTMKVDFNLSNFTPVAMIGKLPYTLMVSPAVKAKNIKELAALAKSKPGQMSGATGGPTGTSFFLLDSFKKAAGIDVVMVAYKGTTLAVTDLLAGRTHMLFAPMVTSLSYYRGGKVQLHGVTGSKRSALIPNVPTFIESGYPMLDVPTWFALLGPAGLPREAVMRVNDAVAKALASKDVVDQLTKVGVDPSGGTPEELDAFLKEDTAMWAKQVRDAGIEPQ